MTEPEPESFDWDVITETSDEVLAAMAADERARLEATLEIIEARLLRVKAFRRVVKAQIKLLITRSGRKISRLRKGSVEYKHRRAIIAKLYFEDMDSPKRMAAELNISSSALSRELTLLRQDPANAAKVKQRATFLQGHRG